MDYRLIILTCLGLIGLHFPQAFAAPAITGVSGTVQDGQTVTISGSGFGATGPNVVFFDSFEKGTAGQPINITEDSADIEEWSSFGDSDITKSYSSAYSISGTKSMQIDFRTGWGAGMRLHYPDVQGTTIAISFWHFIPLDKDVPGTNNIADGGANYKWFWIGDRFDDPFGSDYAGVQAYAFLEDGTPIAIQGPSLGHDEGLPAREEVGYFGDSLWHHGEWLRVTFIMKNSTSSGSIHYQEVSSRGNQVIWDVGNLVTAHSNDPWNVLNLPGYGRYDSNSVIYYDDVYIAIGDGARARVEMGNASTYSASTNLALITPTAWGDTSITATVRQGQFDAEESAYLYVVHADGSVNATGYPVTIGAGAPAQAVGGRLSGSLSGGGVMR